MELVKIIDGRLVVVRTPTPEQTDDRRKPMADELTVTQEDREAIERGLASLRYVLNFADQAKQIRTIMQTFTLPERSTTKERLEALSAAVPALLAQSKADAARIAALEEALRFYARPQSWRSSGVYMSGRSQATAAEIDGGDRARAALETTP